MNKKNIDYTLDEDRLRDLISSLEIARSFGFSSSSSPVDALLEAGIDLALLLKKAFMADSRGRKLSPGIKFLISEEDMKNDPDLGYDYLHNPKQVSINFPAKWYFKDDIKSKFFELLAQVFIGLKENRVNMKDLFMKSFSSLFPIIQPPAEKLVSSPPIKEEGKKNLARAMYWRRQNYRGHSRSRFNRRSSDHTHMK